MAKTTTCDICDEPATVTYEVYVHRAGFRPLLLWLHGGRTAGRMVDLCDDHAEPIRLLVPKGAAVTS